MITIGGFTLPEAIAGSGSLTADGPGAFVDTQWKPAKPPATTATKPPVAKPTKSVETPTTSPGICVTPSERAETRRQNSLQAERSAG